MPTLLLLGGNSVIARACAGIFAAHGWDLLFAGRDAGRMKAIAEDMARRTGKKTAGVPFDALALDTHRTFWEALPTVPDAVLCAVGIYGGPAQHADPEQVDHLLRTNFNGPVHMLEIIAQDFARRGHGTIIGISSVAGLRIRAGKAPYDTSKAAFSAWLAGARARFAKTGIHILTVLPGPVRSPMTEGRDLPPLLVAAPEQAAADIFHAVMRGRSVIYTPWFWRPLMWVARLMPEWLFNRCVR